MVCNWRKTSVLSLVRLEQRISFSRWGNLEQRLRHAALGAEKVDLEDAHVLARSTTSLEHIFEGGVGNESSIPIGLIINRDGREAWRQSAARHDMLRTYRLGGGVEILHVACQYLYRADACPHQPRLQEAEDDKR